MWHTSPINMLLLQQNDTDTQYRFLMCTKSCSRFMLSIKCGFCYYRPCEGCRVRKFLHRGFQRLGLFMLLTFRLLFFNIARSSGERHQLAETRKLHMPFLYKSILHLTYVFYISGAVMFYILVYLGVVVIHPCKPLLTYVAAATVEQRICWVHSRSS